MVSEQTFEELLDQYIERGQAFNRLEAENANLRMNLERVQGHLRYSLQEREELIQAGQEARVGHSARLFGFLDAMKGGEG